MLIHLLLTAVRSTLVAHGSVERRGVVAGVVLVAHLEGADVARTADALLLRQHQLALAAEALDVLVVRVVGGNLELVHLAQGVDHEVLRCTVDPAVDGLVQLHLLVEALLLHPRLGDPEAQVVQGDIGVQEGEAVQEPQRVEADERRHDGAGHRLHADELEADLLHRAHLEPVHVAAVRVAGEEAAGHARGQHVVAEAVQPVQRPRREALLVAGASAIVHGGQVGVAGHGLHVHAVVHHVADGRTAGDLAGRARH
ncbi:P27 protein [Strigomonas culicis]|uniref:p27 protein n=1 Tax=Strigomonas culicis TaxID=28005 RepID=S9U8J0_9TRYP|nr:P27 protein [Strigomonas culicis]|eukprot:EPY27047.1 P27 protein [Strigomonas culicis]